jgi:beta-N-acetylhexosaminidase
MLAPVGAGLHRAAMYPTFFGLAGLSLTPDETAFFTEVRPAGFILFGRNIESRPQVRALTDALRTLTGRDDLPILIDQEGGRVTRLKPPLVPAFPSARTFGTLFKRDVAGAVDAVRANATAMALELRALGITVNCLPVLDIPSDGAHDVIGDRAFGTKADVVTTLGKATMDGLAAGGVVSVIKHIPGHGRSLSDSHENLPLVDASADDLLQDIAPFAALKHAPMAMTAHVVFTAFDENTCATFSQKIIGDVIRQRIGFDGLLMTDDIGMNALSGNFTTRAEKAMAAGVDIILHCSGILDEMKQVAAGLSRISDVSRARLSRAMKILTPEKPVIETLALLLRQRDMQLALA